jgi:pimeloyl-ACP methyl ester carboxylesterase
LHPNQTPITSTLTFRQSTLAYHRWGSGGRLAICLHGYGESGAHFAFLARDPALQHYSFIAIDLPWHGNSIWREGLHSPPSDLEQIIEAILQKEALTDAWHRGIDLIGFSLGGRLALQYFQRNPSQVNKLILLAPDGLKMNGWYWFSTQTWLGRGLFRFTMQYPGWFFFLLKGMNRLGLVNSSVFKFVNHYIGDRPAREILYQRWITLRQYRPRLATCKALIRELNLPVRLLYGRHDRIILPVRGEKFRKGLEEQVQIRIIASGHQVLHEKHGADIRQAILH